MSRGPSMLKFCSALCAFWIQLVASDNYYRINTRLAVVPESSTIYPHREDWSELYATRSGEYLLARPLDEAPLYVSKDFGATFNATGSNVTTWTGVYMSRGDGATIAAVDALGVLYRSRDYGATFEILTNLLTGKRGDVAISDDCTHWIVGLVDSSDVHVSNDCGDTFFSKTRVSATIEQTDQVAISGDGSQMMTFRFGRYQVSRDFGATWTYYESYFQSKATGNNLRNEISVSNDGQYIYTSSTHGYGTSLDHGVTWVPNSEQSGIFQNKGITTTSSGEVVAMTTNFNLAMVNMNYSESGYWFKLTGGGYTIHSITISDDLRHMCMSGQEILCGNMTLVETEVPTGFPTSSIPSSLPSSKPTTIPSGAPSEVPTGRPSGTPSSVPTAQPQRPSCCPTGEPSSGPSGKPSVLPTAQPTSPPTGQPTDGPTYQPTGQPTSEPSGTPSGVPSGQPTGQPSGQPTEQPTEQPTSQPTAQPSPQPSAQPTGQPTGQPSSEPTSRPTRQPTSQPTSLPSSQPTEQPTGQPTGQPTSMPSGQPTGQPSNQPTGQPSSVPTSQPSLSPTMFHESEIFFFLMIAVGICCCCCCCGLLLFIARRRKRDKEPDIYPIIEAEVIEEEIMKIFDELKDNDIEKAEFHPFEHDAPEDREDIDMQERRQAGLRLKPLEQGVQLSNIGKVVAADGNDQGEEVVAAL